LDRREAGSVTSFPFVIERIAFNRS
jgi:hypothetical protein